MADTLDVILDRYTGWLTDSTLHRNATLHSVENSIKQYLSETFILPENDLYYKILETAPLTDGSRAIIVILSAKNSSGKSFIARIAAIWQSTEPSTRIRLK